MPATQRRPLLPLAALLLAGASPCRRPPPPAEESEPPAVDSGDSPPEGQCGAVTVGPWVGAVSPTTAVIAARTDGTCPVELEVATGPAFAEPVLRAGPVWALPESDYVVQIPIAGLHPGEVYQYRLHSDETLLAMPSTRSFRTPPAIGRNASFTLGLLADASSWENGGGQAYLSLAEHDPAFVIQMGDLDHRDPATVSPWVAETWWAMYRDQLALYPAGQALDLALLAQTPFLHTWDDHDFGANNADGSVPWKDLALSAFQTYFPIPSAPAPDRGLWYSFRWGQAEFFVLDVRSQRAPAVMGDGSAKSMLAYYSSPESQKDWLMAQLAASTAVWKFLVSGSCWNRYGKQTDSWALYQAEQRELLAFAAQRGITGLVVISGDIHSGGGIDDGRYAGLPELTVPTTNIGSSSCTGGDCGTWSEGIWVGNEPAGFATVTLRWEPHGGGHSATLATWGADGSARLSLAIAPAQARPCEEPVVVAW